MRRKKKFGELLKDWFKMYFADKNQDYAEYCWKNLQRWVIPKLGKRSVDSIKPSDLLIVLKEIENHSVVVSKKIKSHISATMKYGIVLGLVKSDPTRDLSMALKPIESKPLAAVLNPKEIGQLMMTIEQHDDLFHKLALRFLALTFVRAGEIATAEWMDIMWDEQLWRIPGEKMKMKRPHIVPLSNQAIETLREVREKFSKDSIWVFPRPHYPDRHVTPSYFNRTLRYYIGIPKEKHCAHGFRAMAATMLSENGWSSELIEKQLAHIDPNQVKTAYQRSELLEDRRKMMQFWADFLDQRCAWAVLGR